MFGLSNWTSPASGAWTQYGFSLSQSGGDWTLDARPATSETWTTSHLGGVMLHHVLTVEELTGDGAGVVQLCFYVSTLLVDDTCRNVTTAAWDLDVWEDTATLQVAPAGSAWKGDLDLLALYNGVLTDVQIQQNFHEGAANAIPTTQSLNATIVPGYINNVRKNSIACLALS